ncbi:hypothetical protein [Methylomonas koyamae]|uniref:hypothetical protein n=1 Tax=Methylomonas koyamae TaxID=702114 RepID=UPI000A9A1953|nr:hypothetical protein [Methylomonas koyamae]
MCFAALATYRSHWPPRPTLISGYFHLNFDKQPEWGIDEWRDYARYLEERGQSLANDLKKIRNQLYESQSKLKRSKKNILPSRGTLVTGYAPCPKKGPGRPQGSTRRSQYADCAARAIEIKDSHQEGGFKITDIDAAKKALIEAGYAERSPIKTKNK